MKKILPALLVGAVLGGGGVWLATHEKEAEKEAEAPKLDVKPASAELAKQVSEAGITVAAAGSAQYSPETTGYGRVLDTGTFLSARAEVGAALAAAAAGLALGVSRESVVAGLESMPVAPRVRVLRPDDALVVIDDTYNASPASCIAALDLLAEAPGVHVAILGDMLELGDSTAEAHRIVGAHVPGRATRLIAVGEASRGIAAAAITGGMAPCDVTWVPHAADAAGAFETWRRASGASTRFTVLVKGSRGMRMEQVTDRKSTRLNSSHSQQSRMPSSA